MRLKSFFQSGIGQLLDRLTASATWSPPKPQSDGAAGMRAMPTLTPKPESRAEKDCPKAFHAVRAPYERQATERPKRPKTKTLENNPSQSYKPAPDADESNPRTVANMLNPNTQLRLRAHCF